MKNIMYMPKCLTETFDTKHLCIVAISLIDITITISTEISSDHKVMNTLINSAKEFVNLLGIDSATDLKILPS